MKKLLNKKGFTLMEMLIVVAIIVILVAISIPSFSSSLDKANKATDDANLRSAKAAAVVQELDGFFAADKTYHYDVKTGVFVEGEPDAKKEEDKADFGSCSTHKKASAYIKYDVTAKAKWSNDKECGK